MNYMNIKSLKITYWISTILFAAVTLMGVGQYFFNTEMVREMFTSLNYPEYIVIPLGIAKALGILAILSNKDVFLKNLAYAGFFYVLILGITGHIAADVPSSIPAFIVLILLAISYKTGKKVRAL